jgi:hypothetical protein
MQTHLETPMGADEPIDGDADLSQFLATQKEGTDIYDFVMEVYTGQPSHTKEDSEEYAYFAETETLGLIGVVLTPVILMVLKPLAEALRNGLERGEAWKRIDMARELNEEEGIPLEKAEKMVASVLKALEKRSVNDTAINKII